jgi:hypothetical protein
LTHQKSLQRVWTLLGEGACQEGEVVVLRAKYTKLPHFSILNVLCIQELSPNRLGERKKKIPSIMVFSSV